MIPRPVAYKDQPLPPNPYTPHAQPDWYSAYEAALKLEKSYQIHGRVLGYLMLEALDDDARHYVATGINQFEQEPNGATIHELAQIYIDHFIFLFFHQEGGSPYSALCESYDCDWSDSPSGHMQPWDERLRREFDLDLPTIDPHPKTLQAAKHAALHRDGKRCIMTGNYDYDLWRADLLTQAEQEIAEKALRDDPLYASCTRPTHIFPPFARSDEGESEERSRRRYSFQAIDIVRGYGHIDVMTELKPSHGQRLSNVMSITICQRGSFNHQFFWFEPAFALSDSDNLNTYWVESWQHRGIPCWHHKRRLVKFTTTDDRLELPDPRYLHLHATVCRIACMSGAYMCMIEKCENWVYD